jgi:hypothetical protein
MFHLRARELGTRPTELANQTCPTSKILELRGAIECIHLSCYHAVHAINTGLPLQTQADR